MCRHEKIVLWDHKLYDNERYCYGEIECEVHKLSFYGRPFIKKISSASYYLLERKRVQIVCSIVYERIC